MNFNSCYHSHIIIFKALANQNVRNVPICKSHVPSFNYLFYCQHIRLISWHVSEKQKQNKLRLTVNFCWFQVPLQLVIVLPISVKDIFLASSSSTHLLIQTDFLWFLACVYLRVRRATDGYDKFLFVHIRGHAVWQIALLFFSSGFSEFSFCFIFPHDRASYDL